MKKAFTLIELLVVIAIIAILAAILFPVFAQAKAAAKQSANVSNMKQLGLAGIMYAGDWDDNAPTNNNVVWNGKSVNSGSYYWMFFFSPYIKGLPANFSKSAQGIFVSPNAPTNNKIYLDESSDSPRVTFAEAQGWDKAWGLTRTTNPVNGRLAFSFFCTYAINEHLMDEMNSMTGWQSPAESFFIMEARDSEIEGDELDELYGRTQACTPKEGFSAEYANAPGGGHNGGTSITYLDGHVKWAKNSWGNAADQCATIVRADSAGKTKEVVYLNFPKSTRGGADVREKGWTPAFD
jgi:prepilin-type N-terminal cleavage/methylation domain-containing protein/prepilin-type processing-associated H-X9-DG protein